MINESDNFTPTFKPCPNSLQTDLKETIILRESKNLEDRINAAFGFFWLGMHFYKLSSWMCSDYIPLYGFSGDCFKEAGDLFFSTKSSPRLSMFCYGRAGHCYRASNEYARSTYCFFRSYELSIKLKDIGLTKYYCSEAWKVVSDRCLMLPKVYGLRPEEQLLLDDFILRMDGYDFQWLVWYLLRRKDFDVEVTKRTRDGGIDIFGSYYDKNWLLRKNIIVQCKNPTNKKNLIPVSTIREMIGVFHLQKNHPHEIMIVTTTDFTEDAKITANDSGLPIILVNKDKLFEMLKDIYEFEVFSEDAKIEDEEKTILEQLGLAKLAIEKVYLLQKERSAPFTFIEI